MEEPHLFESTTIPESTKSNSFCYKSIKLKFFKKLRIPAFMAGFLF
jgi:hypothetical protein